MSALVISGCASKTSLFEVSDNQLTLSDNQKILLNLDLSNSTFNSHLVDSCVNDSYTILKKDQDFGSLFIESIDLDNVCHWNGLSSSYFEESIKSSLRLKSLDTIEKYDYKTYTFKTMKVNDESYFNIIYFYSAQGDKFILDYEGKLFNKLIKNFNPNYQNKYLNKKRFFANYKESLVRKNLVNNYFKQEDPDYLN